MNNVEYYKVLLKKKKELKKVKLFSTSGLDETIAVVLNSDNKKEKRRLRGKRTFKELETDTFERTCSISTIMES